MIVTSNLIQTQKVVTIDQNRWSRSVKFTGHDLLEWVVTVDQNTHLRITRLKWTPEEAAGLINREWSGKDVAVTVNGVNFSSIRQAAIAFGKDFKKIYDRYSEKGWSIEQALDLEDPPDTVKFRGKSVTIFGVNYKSVARAAHAHNINSESLRKRIADGISPDDAMTLALQRKRKSPVSK